MGANTVNTMGEAVAPMLASLTGGRCGLRILTNLADRRLARVEATVPLRALRAEGFSPEEVRDGIASASRFAELDPYRAATHNKGVMNGTDAVVMATGNNWRAVEAGAHAYAARSGRYGPLCTWRVAGDDLAGVLQMPLAIGLVGGATRVHPAARLAIRILRAERAADVASAAAAAGMANNLAALRALATEGIQKGHMRLHSRSRSLEDR
jgi:hydroxymethylglutaryl-CoA reductase